MVPGDNTKKLEPSWKCPGGAVMLVSGLWSPAAVVVRPGTLLWHPAAVVVVVVMMAGPGWWWRW